MFLNRFKNIFASREANLPQQMFPGAAIGETFVSETLFPRLRAPLNSLTSVQRAFCMGRKMKRKFLKNTRNLQK